MPVSQEILLLFPRDIRVPSTDRGTMVEGMGEGGFQLEGCRFRCQGGLCQNHCKFIFMASIHTDAKDLLHSIPFIIHLTVLPPGVQRLDYSNSLDTE